MYVKVIETFEPTNAQQLKEINECLVDDFLMTNSRRLTEIFLEKKMPIDLICKLVKKYTLSYKELKNQDVKLANLYTAEVYINCIKENIANENA